MKHRCFHILLLLSMCNNLASQSDSLYRIYDKAYHQIHDMLTGKEPMSFKKAVFITENTYYDNTLSYQAFEAHIQFLVNLSKAYRKSNPLQTYPYADSSQVAICASVFKIMKDSLYDKQQHLIMPPFTYDFEDSFGEKDWRNMFVTKLLSSHTGNCHGLPFLYKMLCEEQGAKAYLAYAPNHIYIKQRNKKDGWYNTELTSGVFPIDAWVMASGYVSIEAIKNGLYMDTLSQHQSLAQCVIDLARGYERLKKEGDIDFVLMCCNMALTYNPHYVEGLLYKSETLKKQYDNYKAHNMPLKEQEIFLDLQSTYVKLAKLGYREIPADMYNQWMTSLKKDKEKYQNKQINRTFNKSK